MSYSKLYSSIVQSSLWNEEDHVRLLFITLLALADREGYVYGSKQGLMRISNLDPDAIDESDPFERLMSEDPDSSDLLRNPENKGRRIEAIEGGFRILNFLYYRSLRNDDDRREQNREAQRRFRAKHQSASVSQRKPRSAKVSQHKPISDADADADAKEESKPKKKATPADMEEVVSFVTSLDPPLTRKDGEWFWNHWNGNGFKNNGKPIACWKSTIRAWQVHGHCPSQKADSFNNQKQRPKHASL